MTELTMTTSATASTEPSTTPSTVPPARASATGSAKAGTIDCDTERTDGGVSPRGTGLFGNDYGMSTIEYALGCVAAAALGALLYLVVTSDSVEAALTGIFERALETK